MHLATLIALCLLLFACSQQEPELPVASEFEKDQVLQAVNDTGKLAATLGRQLNVDVNELRVSTQQFLGDPNGDALSELRQRWKTAHLTYVAAQFGFLDSNRELIFRVDAWPIQPGFIDSLPDYPQSGIVNDENVELNASSLLDQHGFTDDEEVALGFHGIEYLIYERPLEDFIAEGNADRRMQFLKLAVNQLALDTAALVAANPSQYQPEDYGQAFATLQLIFSSNLGKLRAAFRESNLVTAEDVGHSRFSGSSWQTVEAEINSLRAFTVDLKPMADVLKTVDEQTYENFAITLNELQNAIDAGELDEVTRANLPLLLSALTHQLESFDRLLGYKLPAE